MPDWTIWVIIAVAAIAVVTIVILCVALRKRTITFNTGKIKFTEDVVPIKERKGKAIALPVLVAEKYDFTGWYYDAKRTKPAKLTTMPAKNTTLYAGWKKKAQDPYANGVSLGEAMNTNLEFSISLDW